MQLGSRRGFTLLEATAALALLAFGLVFAAQMMSVSARQQQTIGQLLVAQLEAANAAEKIALMPYDAVTSRSLAEMSLSNAAGACLVGGRLSATVETVTDDGPQHKRIHLEVAWTIGDEPTRTVKLTAWKYDAPTARR